MNEHFEISYGKPDKHKVKELMHEGKKDREKKKGCGCVNKCPHTISNTEGEFVINVSRTYNLNVPLPYCIWGTLYLNSNYGTVITPYLPAGITFVGNTITAGGNVVFTYSNGTDTDTVTVSVPNIGLISYAEIISGLKTNYMKTCFMTFDCNSDVNAPSLDNTVILNMQAQGLFIQKVGGAGSKNAQLIIPKSRRQINNTVMNIIEIYLRNEEIKPESVWVHVFPYLNLVGIPPEQVLYTFTVFITETVDMNAELTKRH